METCSRQFPGHRDVNKLFLLGSHSPREQQVLQQCYRGSRRTEMGFLCAEVRLCPGGWAMLLPLTAGMELRTLCRLLFFLLVVIRRDLLIPLRGCRPVLASSLCTVRGMPAWAGKQPRLRQSQGAVKNGRMWALKGKNSRNEPDCRVQITCIYSRSQCALEDTKCQVFESAEAAQSDSKPV